MPERKIDEMVCLNCTLFACDESSPECAYQLQLGTRTIVIKAAPPSYDVLKRREQYRASKARARRRSLIAVPQPATRKERQQATFGAMEEAHEF